MFETDMNPFIITLYGPFSISWYGLFVVLGVGLFMYLAYVDMRRSAIASTEKFFDCALAGLVGGLIGGKILFLLGHREYLSWTHWQDAAGIILGGFAILGGIVGASLALYGMARFHRIDILPLLDLAGAYALVAHSVARIGCFISGCCYGMPVVATSFWAVVYRHPYCLAPLNQPLFPAQLVMSLVSLIGFFLCYRAYQIRGRRDGFVFCIYILWETSARFLIDFLRGDREHVFLRLSMYQWVSVGIIGAALFFLVVKVHCGYTRRRW